MTTNLTIVGEIYKESGSELPLTRDYDKSSELVLEEIRKVIREDQVSEYVQVRRKVLARLRHKGLTPEEFDRITRLLEYKGLVLVARYPRKTIYLVPQTFKDRQTVISFNYPNLSIEFKDKTGRAIAQIIISDPKRTPLLLGIAWKILIDGQVYRKYREYTIGHLEDDLMETLQIAWKLPDGRITPVFTMITRKEEKQEVMARALWLYRNGIIKNYINGIINPLSGEWGPKPQKNHPESGARRGGPNAQ